MEAELNKPASYNTQWRRRQQQAAARLERRLWPREPLSYPRPLPCDLLCTGLHLAGTGWRCPMRLKRAAAAAAADAPGFPSPLPF